MVSGCAETTRRFLRPLFLSIDGAVDGPSRGDYQENAPGPTTAEAAKTFSAISENSASSALHSENSASSALHAEALAVPAADPRCLPISAALCLSTACIAEGAKVSEAAEQD